MARVPRGERTVMVNTMRPALVMTPMTQMISKTGCQLPMSWGEGAGRGRGSGQGRRLDEDDYWHHVPAAAGDGAGGAHDVAVGLNTNSLAFGFMVLGCFLQGEGTTRCTGSTRNEELRRGVTGDR